MKGMAYTSFALLSATLLLGMAFVSVSNPDFGEGDASRISEASFFLKSVLSDMDRSLRIATRRALTGSTAYVVDTGKYLEDPEKNISSVLINGTLSGEKLNSTENASLADWTEKVSDIGGRSGYEITVDLRNYSFNASALSVSSSYSVFTRLKDPSTLASFNETESQNVTVSAEGLEDPLLLVESKGRYISKYSVCGFEDPSNEVLTGNIGSEGHAYGEVKKNPSDISSISDKSEKILAVDDVESYSQSDVNSFEAAISAQPNSSEGYTTEYAFDTGSITEIEQNETVIVSEGDVWRSGFGGMLFDDCYVDDSDGPGFVRRAGGSFEGQGDGVVTLVDVSSLPDALRKVDSSVGYEYFDSLDSEIWKIRGISDEYSWFRLSDRYVEKWGLEEIAYK